MTYVWKPNIHVNSTDKFYDFEVFSGYAPLFVDPEAEEILLAPEASDELLGQCVLKSLKQSRNLSGDYAWSLRQQVPEKYQIWIQERMRQFGYKGKRALFKNMKNCSIELHKDMIVIKPNKQEKLGGWSGDEFTEEDYVKIPTDSPLEEIGAALRLAFTRCK